MNNYQIVGAVLLPLGLWLSWRAAAVLDERPGWRGWCLAAVALVLFVIGFAAIGTY